MPHDVIQNIIKYSSNNEIERLINATPKYKKILREILQETLDERNKEELYRLYLTNLCITYKYGKLNYYGQYSVFYTKDNIKLGTVHYNGERSYSSNFIKVTATYDTYNIIIKVFNHDEKYSLRMTYEFHDKDKHTIFNVFNGIDDVIMYTQRNTNAPCRDILFGYLDRHIIGNIHIFKKDNLNEYVNELINFDTTLLYTFKPLNLDLKEIDVVGVDMWEKYLYWAYGIFLQTTKRGYVRLLSCEIEKEGFYRFVKEINPREEIIYGREIFGEEHEEARIIYEKKEVVINSDSDESSNSDSDESYNSDY